MSNPAPTLNQINAFNATIGTTIDFNIIGGTEVIRSNKIYIYDLSDNSLICTHLYVSTESIHELPPNTSSSIVYASGKSSADFTNNTQYYAQIQTFTDTNGTQGASGLSIAKLFWCLPTPTLTLSTIPTTISTTSYNVSATYTPNTSGSATNEIQEFQFNLYSAIGALLQTSGVVLYGGGVDLSYNFSGLEVDSTYYVTLDVTTTQGMNVSAQSNTFTVSIDTPTMGSASVVNNGCDGYISVTSNLSSEYEHEESVDSGEIMSFTTDSVNDIIELDVDFEPVQDGTPWMSAQNTEPYMFRAVPTQTEDFGHESDTIVGGTVAWNQLVVPKDASVATSGITFTANGDGKITISGTATTVASIIAYKEKPTYTLGHKYLIFGCPSGGSTSTYNLRYNVNGFGEIGNGVVVEAVSANAANKQITVGSTFPAVVVANGYAVSGSLDFYPQVFDLTQMFGSTIADYIYSLEQATAGAGVAWFKKLFPKDYYAYDAGSLVSVSGLTSHDMVGFNQWDEEWEVGGISASTGLPDSATDRIRAKNYIPVVSGTSLYFKTGENGQTAWQTVGWFYDSDKNPIGTVFYRRNAVLAVPTGAKYVRFAVTSGYGTTYKNDICINLSDASLNGTYKPYTKHSYPLDSDLVLRGIPKLDASNNLYYDGDRYNADGSVDRRYGIVDLGSLNWTLNSTYPNIFNADRFGNIKFGTQNLVCVMYQPSTSSTIMDTDKAVAVSTGSDVIYIKDTAYSDATAFKTAMSGIYLVYEKATPNIETADPFTNPQIVDPSGTEEYVGSPIPVGHKTTYQRICPITGWTGCEVDVAGVNLFDEETSFGTNGGVLQSDGSWYFANLNTLYGKTVWNNPKGYSGQVVFTFIRKATIANIQTIRFVINYTDGTYDRIGYVAGTGNFDTYTLVTPTNKTVLSVVCDYGTNVATYIKLQIEIGSTATPYKPYQGTTYTSTFPKYKQQLTQDTTPYITKDIGDTYADTLTENLVGGTIAWNQSVPDTTTTHTVSGSIASMDDAVAGNFESVVCDITPVQYLHGYDYPWVGGAGKNKWEPFSGTNRGITFTPQTDGTVKIQGTVTTAGWVQIYSTHTLADFDLSVGDSVYVFSNNVTLDNGFVGLVRFLDSNNTKISDVFQNATGTVPQNAVSMRLYMYGYGSSAPTVGDVINTTGYFEFGKGSTLPTSWTPWENLCPITGWTGCEVVQAGVNLFDKSTATDGKYYQLSGGTINEVNNAPYGHSILIPIKPSTSYCMTGYAGSGYYSIICLDEYMKPITTWYGAASKTAPFVATTPNNAKYCYLNYLLTQKDSLALYEATSVGDFIPYNGTTYPVSWQTEAGTVYGGTVDLVTGVLTVTPATADMGTLNWVYVSGGNYFYAVISDKAKGFNNIKCSAYEVAPNAGVANLQNGQIVGGMNDTAVYVKDSRYTDAVSFKAGVSGYQLVYELATPTTYQLDPVQVACLLGQNNVWNNISNTTVTYPTNHSYQSLSTTHKYYKRINGVESISVGSDVVADVGTDNIIDLTQMFGTTIADYIYNIEQSSSSGMGVKFFKSLFPNDDYDYNSGELISVNASAHVIKDANGNVLHTYPLDSDLVLRGIPKLDANNKLYYDGDVYEPDGGVTRKYGIVDLGTLNYSDNGHTTNVQQFVTFGIAKKNGVSNFVCEGYVAMYSDRVGTVAGRDATNAIVFNAPLGTDVATFKASMSGTYMVYEKATPTTEQADPFEENQAIVSDGIEEYVVTEQGDVEMPVGHDSTYYATEVYGGTIDMAKGVLTIDMVSVDLGSLTWSLITTGETPYFRTSTDAIPYKYLADQSNFICENYPHASIGSTGSAVGIMITNTISIRIRDNNYSDSVSFKNAMNGVQLVYELETPIEISLTPQQIQTLSGQNNIWGNTNGGMFLIYQLPITSLLVKRRDVADVSGKWLTLYSTPITQADDMDFTFIDFLNQYGKTYQYALVPVLAQDQSGVIVQIEGGYTVSDNVDSIFDGVYIADQTNVERVKAGVGYGNIDMNQGVGSITPIGSKYPIVITNSQNQYHNGSVRGTIVPNDFYSNGNLSRIDMVNKRDELEQFLTNKRAKIIKDWNGKMWLVMIMSNVSCTFDDNYGMGIVSFSADWLEVGDPTNQQDLYNAGLINVGGA